MIEIVYEVDVTLINASASDEMVAMAAWVSHNADSEDRLKNVNQVTKLIHFLYSNKHMSPFEHGLFTFKIDAPLFVAREFFRHRTASYNEVSGRYTEMKPRFYSATVAREQHGKPGDYYFEDGSEEQSAIYLQTKHKAIRKAWKTYQQRLEAGIAKEQAREELPLSLMTQWYVTMNPRNLMQFLTLRNEKHALKEIQDVAVKMEAIFAEIMPLTYKAYTSERDKTQVDVKSLNDRILELEAQNRRLADSLEAQKRAHDDKYRLMLDAYRERDEALKVRDEAVDRYNRAFTTQQESINTAQRDEPEPDFEDVDIDYNVEPNAFAGAVDYLLPRAAKIAEAAAPLYNVYISMDKSASPEKVALEVLRAIKKQKGWKP